MIFSKRLLLNIGSLLLGFGLNAQVLYSDVIPVGAMRNVKWKGELAGIINLDTIKNKTGLYGLGPQSYLTGELLINNGVSFLSKVTSDSTMEIIQTTKVEAPFFVYGYVNEWTTSDLPAHVIDIKSLEQHLDAQTKEYKRPFVFKLRGRISEAQIHIQNLPQGTKVSSPKDAHTGQVKYLLQNEEVEIIGFFSTTHQGVFTHHDTYLHMHLITIDKQKMGHLDWMKIASDMQLMLPVN